MASNTKSIDFELSSSQYAYIADGDQTGLDITGDISVEAWVNFEQEPNTVVKEFTIMSKYNNGLNQRSYNFFFDANNKLNFVYTDDGTYSGHATRAVSDVAAMDDGDLGNWVYFAATADVSAKDIKIYRNGALIDSTKDQDNATSIDNGTAKFIVGAYENNTTFQSFFDGKIDEAIAWNVVRTGTEIGESYNSGDGKIYIGNESGMVAYHRFEDNALDTTSNDNDLTLVNSPSYSSDVPFVGATTTSTTTTSTSSSTSSSTTTTSTSSSTTTTSTSSSSSTTTTSTSTTSSTTTTSTSTTTTSTSTTTTSTSSSTSSSTSTTTTSTSSSTSSSTTTTSTSSSTSTSSTTTSTSSSSSTTTTSTSSSTSTSTTTTSTSTTTTTTLDPTSGGLAFGAYLETNDYREATGATSANFANPTNAITSNDSYATFTGETGNIVFTDFGDFDIPAGCTIKNIIVELEGYRTGEASIRAYLLSFSWDDGSTYAVGGTESEWTWSNVLTSDTTHEYTVGAEDFDHTFVPNDFQDGNLAIKVTTSTNETIAWFIDNIKVKVQYEVVEESVSWQTWVTTGEIIGDADWGKLAINITENGYSKVYDYGDATERTYTLERNKYGAGQGTATLQIRGQAALFTADAGTPVWSEYTVPITESWRYIQVREIKT